MKKVALIYSGYDQELNSLKNNRKGVAQKLEDFGGWEIKINKPLLNEEQFTKDIDAYKNDDIDDLLIYYTGHGRLFNDVFELQMSEKIGITLDKLYGYIKQNFENHALLPKRIAIVIDACYSGQAVKKTTMQFGTSEILASSLEGMKSFETGFPKGVISDMSLFSHYFCDAIETLRIELEEINLSDIQTHINKYVEKQISPRELVDELGFMPMVIAKGSTFDLLKSIQTNLKKVIDDEATLRVYASNILSQKFNDVNLSTMKYDEIVKHLYDLREPIGCLLKNLKRSELKKDFDTLKLMFPETSLDNCCSTEKMKQESLNLLITFEPKDDDISRTEVRIWRYEEPYAVDKVDLLVDLTKENPTDLIDKIFSSVNVSENNVLLEFILPYELLDINMTSWSTSCGESLVETYRIVRRAFERIEKLRDNDGKIKSWKDFWGYYENNKEKSISSAVLPHNKKIRFINFKTTPYIRLDEQLSMEQLNKIINTSASIVMSPTKDKVNELNTECKEIQNETLNSLIEKDFEMFCDIPHILIWDNPNRQIRVNPEITGGD